MAAGLSDRVFDQLRLNTNQGATSRRAASSTHTQSDLKRLCLSQTSIQANVPLTNRFNPFLQDSDADNGAVPLRHKPAHTKKNVNANGNKGSLDLPVADKAKSVKYPPIVITDERLSDLNKCREVVDALGLEKFMIKNMSVGKKVQVFSKEDNDKCILSFNNNDVHYYTHRLNDQKLFKVVLAGLPNIETSVIASELKTNHNIEPLSISALNSNPNQHNKLFLLTFSKSEFSLKLLKQVRHINNIIVNWRPFSPKYKGPTQCKRCSMFGHGAENCHRKEVCLLCADASHTIASCPFASSDNSVTVNFKCFNCIAKNKTRTGSNLLNANHKANDPMCPCRQDYLEVRNIVNHRNVARNGKKQFNPGNDFPALHRVPNVEDSPINVGTSVLGPTFADPVRQPVGDSDLYSMD